MNNQAAYMTAPQQMEIRDCPMPVPAPGELLIRIEYCGVCGSDVGYFRDGRIGKRVVPTPFILGHECTGEVVQVGPETRGFSIGDRVVLEPGLGCGTCRHCTSGRYNLCPDMKFLATPPYDGAFRKYMAYPARGCFKLPLDISMRDGAMIEPLAVGLHAAHRGGVDHSKTVLIIGMGCIGLMTLMACRSMNAQRIIVSDVFDNRLAKAMELGADDAVNGTQEDLYQRVMELTGGEGCGVVFETAGRPETASQTISLVSRGGVIVQVGTIASPVPYQLNELGHKEADIRSVFRYCNIFPLAIELIRKGDIPLAKLEPSEFSFERISDAFDTALHHGRDVIKCIVRF